MAKLNNITVNISLNGPIDVEKLAEEFKASIRKEIERVGVKVELASQYRKLTDGKPKAGDFVKFTDVRNHDDITAGKYYEIVEIDSDGDFNFYDDVDDFHNVFTEDGEVYEKVTPCCAPVGQPTPEPLKVGDYAKVLSAGEYGGVDVGTIGIVVDGYGESHELRVDRLDGGDHDYFVASQLEKVSADEVAKLQSERAVAEKWAEIGRKPNEFKKGDIVRITKYQLGAEEGSIVEVKAIFSEGSALSYTGGFGADFSAIELIMPVEARFDREKDALA